MAVLRGFFPPALMDYFQKRLFSKIMVWKRQFTVTIATYKADGYLTAIMGGCKQGGLKMYFHSYWYERLRLLSWKNKLTPTEKTLQRWVLAEFTRDSFCRVFLFIYFGFSFFVVVAFALFMLSLQWHNPMCPGRIAQQLTLLRFCQFSSVAWDWSPPNIPPFHRGMGGMGWWNALVTSPCAVYCELGVSESVSLFVFKGQFIFNLTRKIFSSSLAHILSSLWASQLGMVSVDLVFPRSISCREKWKKLPYAKE